MKFNFAQTRWKEKKLYRWTIALKNSHNSSQRDCKTTDREKKEKKNDDENTTKKIAKNININIHDFDELAWDLADVCIF